MHTQLQYMYSKVYRTHFVSSKKATYSKVRQQKAKIIDSKNGKFKEQKNERMEIICSCLSVQHTHTHTQTLARGEKKKEKKKKKNNGENGKLKQEISATR